MATFPATQFSLFLLFFSRPRSKLFSSSRFFLAEIKALPTLEFPSTKKVLCQRGKLGNKEEEAEFGNFSPFLKKLLLPISLLFRSKL